MRILRKAQTTKGKNDLYWRQRRSAEGPILMGQKTNQRIPRLGSCLVFVLALGKDRVPTAGKREEGQYLNYITGKIDSI
jgi:hypothetical protein